MLIQKVTPEMLRSQPDQFTEVINRLIAEVNALSQKK